MNSSYVRGIEKALLIVGLLLLTIFVAARIHKAVLSRAALNSFHSAQEAPAAKETSSLWDRQLRFDSSLWSSQRLAAYEESLAAHFAPPLAILRIRKFSLEAPVLPGTDDLTLNRGVGLIAGTNPPGEGGRIGIAGHRDGFFRVLKDIGPGDMIELETIDRIDFYRVSEIVIVKPDDVSVLRPTNTPTLSLVTCYPFYFIGSAPQRYIVVASLVNSGKPANDSPLPQTTNSVSFEPAEKTSTAQSQASIKETTQ
jgi:sortase A